jgi:hypothetical protein
MSAPPGPDSLAAPEGEDESRPRRIARIVMQVLWPAFLMAIVAEGVFFSMIDPRELQIVAEWLRESRVAAYTVAFFLFWLLFAGSSGITYLLAHGVGTSSRER